MIARNVFSVSLACAIASMTSAVAQDVAFFEAKVLPVLKARCYECHSHAGKIKGGLVLDSRSGWQAGGESYGYVVFLMSDKAVKYLDKSMGWEFGVGPSVVAVNEGIAKNLSTSTLKDDAYAFIFDQQGLMASLSLEGTKISRIKR